MDDIKFRCPECTQKIAVSASAAGVKIDCPTCHSRLVIPRAEHAPVEVLIKRKLAVAGGDSDAVYEELKKSEVAAEKAAAESDRLLAEIARLRAGHETEAGHVKAELMALQLTCDSLTAEVAELKPLRAKLSEKHDEKSAAENQRLSAELERLRAEHNTAAGQAKAELKVLQSKCDSLSAEVEALKPEGANLSATQDDKAAAEIDRLRAENERLMAAHEKEAGHVKAELVALQLTCDSLNSEAAALKPLRQNLSETHEELIDARRQVAAAAKEFVAVQTERNEMAAQVSSLNAVREDLAKAQLELEHARQDAIDAVRVHQSQAENATRAEAALREEFDALQSGHNGAQARLAEQAKELAGLRREVEQLALCAETLPPLRDQLRETQEDLAHTREEADAAASNYRQELENIRQDEIAMKARLEEFETKRDDAEVRLAAQALEITTLRDRHSELETHLAGSTSLHEDLAEMERQFNATREELVRTIQQRDDAVHSTEAVADAARVEGSAEIQAKLSDAERRLAAFGHGFSGLQKEHEELGARAAAAAKAAAAELAAAREESQHIRSQLSELQSSLDATNSEHEQTAALAAERQKSIAELSQSMETAKAELARAREELAANVAEQSRSKAGTEKSAKDGGKLQERVKRLVDEGGKKDQELAELQKNLEAAQAAATAKEDRVQELTAKAKALADLMDEQEKTMRDVMKEAAQQRAQHSDAKERIEKAERLAAEAMERTKPIEDEAARLSAELSRTSSELDTLREDLSKARASRPAAVAAALEGSGSDARERALEAERDALRAELDGVKSALERAKQHVSVLQARRDLLRDEIAKLRARLGIGGEVTAAGGKPLAS